MRITESTLRRIIREEIVGHAVREGRMSPRLGRHLMREEAYVNGRTLVQKLKDAGEEDQAERMANNTHIRRDMEMSMSISRQGTGDIALYSGNNLIEVLPKEVAKKAGISPEGN
jgi:hypothetical protein